jgi:hypothetical protein
MKIFSVGAKPEPETLRHGARKNTVPTVNAITPAGTTAMVPMAPPPKIPWYCRKFLGLPIFTWGGVGAVGVGAAFIIEGKKDETRAKIAGLAKNARNHGNPVVAARIAAMARHI